MRGDFPQKTGVGGIDTPLEELPGLARRLGFRPGRLLVKRDDLIGVAGGGNKVRKGLVAVEEAVRADSQMIVTTGAPQSNHVRVTAALGARAGLHVVLVLEGRTPPRPTGNVLLDALFGAELVWAGENDPESVARDIVDARRRRGERVYRVPFGGSSPLTLSAYEGVGRELDAVVPGLRHVVTAVGSGGTMAGLVAALGADRVLGVDSGAVSDPVATVERLLAAAGLEPGGLRIDRELVGAGYEHVHPDVARAIRETARSDAVVFDPVYSGRALSGLARAVKTGEIGTDEPTVLLHSGGLPGLFGHPEAERLIVEP